MDDGVSPSVTSLIAESQALQRADQIGPALQRAQAALEHAQADGDSQAIATALARFAGVRYFMGQYEASRALAEQVLTLAAPDTEAHLAAWLLLGHYAAETDSLAEAEDYYHRVADLAREIDCEPARYRALQSMAAAVYSPRGQFDLALAAGEEARRIGQAHAPECLYITLGTLTWLYLLTGQTARARASLDEMSRSELVTRPGSAVRGWYLSLAAQLAQEEGDWPTALSLCPGPLYRRGRRRSVLERLRTPGAWPLPAPGRPFIRGGGVGRRGPDHRHPRQQPPIAGPGAHRARPRRCAVRPGGRRRGRLSHGHRRAQRPTCRL